MPLSSRSSRHLDLLVQHVLNSDTSSSISLQDREHLLKWPYYFTETESKGTDQVGSDIINQCRLIFHSLQQEEALLTDLGVALEDRTEERLAQSANFNKKPTKQIKHALKLSMSKALSWIRRDSSASAPNSPPLPDTPSEPNLIESTTYRLESLPTISPHVKIPLPIYLNEWKTSFDSDSDSRYMSIWRQYSPYFKIWDSIESIKFIQSIQFLAYSYWNPGSICVGPVLQTEDKSLDDYIISFCTASNDVCTSSSCEHKKGSHIAIFVHSNSRIEVSVKSSESPLTITNDSDSCTSLWTTCTLCKASSNPKPLSAKTLRLPLIRFLSFLCYHTRLVPDSLCLHHNQRDLIQWNFQRGGFVVSFSVEAIDVFSLVLPQLQVLPRNEEAIVQGKMLTEALNHAPLFFADTYLVQTTQKRLESLPVSFNDGIRRTRLEISYFFASTKRRLEAMESYSLSFPDIQESEQTIAAKNQITAFMTETASAEIELMALLDQCDERWPWWVNDVRRKFKETSANLVKAIEAFQKAQFGGMKDRIPWQLPEYCQSSTCRIYPKSAVIVRETEPTSILAYALSCEEFKAKLTTLTGAQTSPNPPSPSSPIINLSAAIFTISGGIVDTASKALQLGVGSPAIDAADFIMECSAFSHKPATDSPKHIRLKFAEDKMVFTCKIYYAAEFESLRRRCDIESGFVESLARCSSWNASGGKTKAAFFKTQDDRFVVKQLASNWSIVEKDHLLDFAPQYFEYLNQKNKPSVLAKIFGFFSIKQKNLESGIVNQIDLLVMENVFHSFEVERVFDFKGIPDRRSGGNDTSNEKGESRVLWDGDWIDGGFKLSTLLSPPSKRVLMEALESDTKFLTQANTMDYSLLIGIGKDSNQIRVGIIDFIGPYTMLKMVETKGKTALRGNATVIPPENYAQRFCAGIDQYFYDVPSYWTIALDV